jgi:hypothetical protein
MRDRIQQTGESLAQLNIESKTQDCLKQQKQNKKN